MLKIFSFLFLLFCLFIISQIIQKLKSKKKKQISGILYLHSNAFIEGLKIIFLAITILGFKEGLSLIEEGKTLKITIYIEDLLGIIAALILSYGLFLIIYSFRERYIKFKEGKKN